MTKYVRIENADTSNWKVRVTIQERKYDHDTKSLTDEWIDVKVIDLDYPTMMATEYLTSTRRFIVEENGPK